MSDKPKIKLTKTLPSEIGSYLWAPDTLNIQNSEVKFYYGDGTASHDGHYANVSEIGGYWAKVDQSIFEMEG